MTIVRQFRALSSPVQLLLVNNFTIFVGFYMLYPYLAIYFREDLGFSAWMVGLVLGIRVFSQQGLTVIGGTLADQIGYKPVILLGLVLRAFGFMLFGFADGFVMVLAAAILSGLGGAVFSPAMRAYISVETKGQRAEAFALSNVFGQAGSLLGPLVGLALLGVSFQVVAVVAGVLFLVLTLAQVVCLPDRSEQDSGSRLSVLSGWGEVLKNRPFLLFALAMLGQFTLLNQLYLGLPLEIERLTGSQAPVGILFIVSSLLTIGLQVQVTQFCKARWRPITSTSIGLLLMGLAFVPPLVATPLLPLDAGSGSSLAQVAAYVANITPALLSAIILAVGIMVSNPFAMEMVPFLGRDRLTATYFGVYNMASGIGATLGNIGTGFAFDLQSSAGLTGLPWLLMIGIGLGSGLYMRLLARRPVYTDIPANSAAAV